MKNLKFICTFLALGLLTFTSCENDGGDSVINLDEGGVPNILKVSGSNTFLDLNALESGEETSIEFSVDRGQGDIVSMDVVLFYKSGDNVYRAVLELNLTTFPKTYSLTQFDIIDAFPELNSVSDFQIGDVLSVSADLTLANGRVLNILKPDGSPNYGQDIANSNVYKVLQTYVVSCPSDLGGTYNVVSSGTSTDPGATNNPISNYSYVTTLTDNGGGNYTMSDAFGGVYIQWYTVFGLDFEVEAELTDICGTLSGAFTDPFGGEVELTGTVNPDGTLTIDWTNSFGDVGQSVYTLQ